MVTTAKKERHLFLGKKAMTNPDSILKSKDIILLISMYKVKAMVSSSHVLMWELNHKQGWDQRTDAFELWCWRKLLRVPWNARKSKPSILKEMNLKTLKWRRLKLKLQYFGHLMLRGDSLEKTLMLTRRREQRKRCLGSITDSMDMNLSKLREIEDRGA